ncbi:MAG: porin family protein [Flavobacteriales bacterium]|nr:PorT family protein [Flavobacteriales bacterium]
MYRSILFTFVLLAGSCFAQEGGHHGPRLGLGMATQTTGALFQNSSNLRLAPVLGWYIEAPLHEQVGLMVEALWLTKGSAYRNPANSTRSRNTYRYAELPVLLKVSVNKDPNGLFLLAGPSLGYLLSGRIESWTNGDKTLDVKYSRANGQNRFQFSGLVGIGIESESLTFDVRAQTSLTPFDRFARIQNVVYAVTVGYRFSTKKKEKDEELEEDNF